MTDATKAISLQEAVKAHSVTGDLDADNIVKTAKTFEAFFYPNNPAAPAQTSSRPTPPAPAKAVPGAKNKTPAERAAANKTTAAPAGEDAAAAAAVAEGTAAAAAEDAAGDAEPAGPTKQDVGDVVAKLLAANKRADAQNLLKKFKATSVSGVKPADYAAFIEEGSALLGDADLTA